MDLAPEDPKEEFKYYLKLAHPIILNLPDLAERARAVAWMKKLLVTFEVESAQLKNDYIKLLLFALQQKSLGGPFANLPNVDAPLPPFPDNRNLTEMVQQMLDAETPNAFSVCREPCKYMLEGQGMGSGTLMQGRGAGGTASEASRSGADFFQLNDRPDDDKRDEDLENFDPLAGQSEIRSNLASTKHTLEEFQNRAYRQCTHAGAAQPTFSKQTLSRTVEELCGEHEEDWDQLNHDRMYNMPWFRPLPSVETLRRTHSTILPRPGNDPLSLKFKDHWL